MTAYIRVAAAACAVSVGAICGSYAHRAVTDLRTSVVKPGLSIVNRFYAPRVSCTLTWTGHDTVVFTDTSCTRVPGFISVAGYAPVTGDPQFGVACALRNGDGFDVVASHGNNPMAGLLCQALINKGWVEDPVLGTDFNAGIQEFAGVISSARA